MGKEMAELTLRMLGYYNNPRQFLKEELERPDEAYELGILLMESFNNIKDDNLKSEDSTFLKDAAGFAAALENGVFVLRDKDSKLYAFWPKDGIARVTNVVYNKDEITILPLEYKNWFTPGAPIQIGLRSFNSTNTLQKTLLEHLNSIDSIGKTINLNSECLGEKLTGELLSLGKDFLCIKDNNSNIHYVAYHFHVEFPAKREEKLESLSVLDNNDPLPILGYVLWYDSNRELGNIKTTEGDILGLRGREILENNLRKGSKVIFSIKEKMHSNGNKMKQAISVHMASTVSSCFVLAQTLQKKGKILASRDVLQHILDVYPDNEEVMIEQLKLPYQKEKKELQIDEDTLKFNKACELVINPNTAQKAIDEFLKIFEKGKKIKDCISRIAIGYSILYDNESEDELKSVIRRKFYDFIRKNHMKLSPSGSLNIRLQYFKKLGFDEAYLETLDSILQDPQTDINKRAKMLYFKAVDYFSKERKEEALSYARESLYLSPFGNKSETMLPEYSNEENIPTEVNFQLQDVSRLIVNTKIDNLETIQNNTFVNKQDSMYHKKILFEAQNGNLNATAEYISILAYNLSKEKKYLESALYLWNRLFRMINNFGYFVQDNLALVLSCILKISIVKDPTFESIHLWENKKYWKHIFDETKSISKEQWELIYYVVKDNEKVVQQLESYLSSKNQIKDNIEKLFNIKWNGQFNEFLSGNKNGYNDNKSLSVFVKGSVKQNTLLDQYTALLNLSDEKDSFTDMTRFDKQLLDDFYCDCFKHIQNYILESIPEIRTKIAKTIYQSIEIIKDRICSFPTQFGVEGLLLRINAIESSLKGVQYITRKRSQPEISIEIKTKNVTLDNEGFYNILAVASNAESSINASNVHFTLMSKNVKAYERTTLSFDVLEGGSSIELNYRVKLNDDNKVNFVFAITCEYSSNGENHTKIFNPLQVYLLQSDLFVHIERNPYTYGPYLEYNDPTFVGRQADIKNIIETVLHPQREGAQIIVYGQKRCGKSSLVKAVESKLKEDYSSEAFCVYFTLRIDNLNSNKVYTDSKFYTQILKAIEISLVDYKDENRPVIKVPSKLDFEQSNSPVELFSTCIMEFKRSMAATKGWERRRLVLIIDEFTILYNGIKKNVVSEDILHHWKGIQESKLTNFPTIFVGHDITPTFFAEPYSINSVAIIEKYPLSYLEQKDAIDLIVNPIKCNDESRFEDKAIKKILYYTSGSPSYLQMFMRRMVDYINENKTIKVSDIDVYNVAQRFIIKQYDEFSSIDKFDNLINSGLDDRYCLIKDADFEKVLRIIARRSKGIEWCKKEDVVTEVRNKNYFIDNSINLDDILDDLDARKVIERKENNEQIKIKVGLFKEWLIRN